MKLNFIALSMAAIGILFSMNVEAESLIKNRHLRFDDKFDDKFGDKFGDCKDLVMSLCGDCPKSTNPFECMKLCIHNSKDALEKAGCTKWHGGDHNDGDDDHDDDDDHDHDHDDSKEKCKELYHDLCGNCTESDNRIECMFKCYTDNKQKLDDAGCKIFKGDSYPFVECGKIFVSLCKDCTTSKNPFDCIRTCIKENKDDFKESGCFPKDKEEEDGDDDDDDDGDGDNQLEKCKDLIKNLCLKCDKYPIYLKPQCYMRCLIDNDKEIKDNGCEMFGGEEQ